MGEIKEEGKIMWKMRGKLFDDKQHAELFSSGSGCAIERVRVTPEPEPERFYVDNDTCHPIEVRDRKKGRHTAVARFWDPLGDRAFILERAEIHADWLNEEDKKDNPS